jgi:hypothetical protein
MQEAAQETILNDNNVLLLSHDRFRENLAFFTNIRNVTAWSTFGSMFNSGSFQRIRPANWASLEKMGTDYKVNVCAGSIETEIKNLSNPPAVL